MPRKSPGRGRGRGLRVRPPESWYVPGKNQDRHHIKPRSRGGTDADGIVVLPKYIHKCWHMVFDGMMLREAHIFIDVLMQPGKWTYRNLLAARRQIMMGQTALVVPRGADHEGVVVLPMTIFQSWNKLFDGMRRHQVHAFVDAVMQSGLIWTFGKWEALRRQIMSGRFE